MVQKGTSSSIQVTVVPRTAISTGGFIAPFWIAMVVAAGYPADFGGGDSAGCDVHPATMQNAIKTRIRTHDPVFVTTDRMCIYTGW